MSKKPIFSFGHGLVLGLISGAVYGLLNNRKSGAENRQQITNYTQDTIADVQKLNDARERLQNAVSNLKDSADEYLTPATDGIKRDVAAYQFKVAPLLDQISTSLDAINDAANSDDNNKDV
ncbi:YtxH domain-containing protein [Lacticaseibacillus pabuli]|uniref:YtxH domain-containing protein n=1 Tax=Lacticaseibacillus pabuli TaxID=3025672 RepID=A0ABY7WUS2_9LACO|nr:YtxH domain-containing protein [Lacticaseibacillus sp. KACC 23028]WDF83524.1 YtxH domain-containing protein [Lacticaseibacillus sp. KACC 23028]